MGSPCSRERHCQREEKSLTEVKGASVDEFITVERPTRPVFRVAGLTVRTLESVG
jgi:hypothetical protein